MITVLVVEDSNIKFDKINTALKSFGVEEEYIERTISIECSEKELNENQYDLVILDMVLPQSLLDSTKDKEGGLSILEDIVSAIEDDNNLKVPNSVLVLTEFEDVLKEYTDIIHQCRVFSLIYNAASNDWVKELEKEVKKLQRLKKQNDQRKFDKNVLITVHGIRTNGKWQEKMNQLLDSNYSVEPYKYNFFSLFSFFSEKKVENEIEAMVSFIERTVKNHPKAKFHFVSHSFGTYLVYNALSKIDKSLPIGNIIFGGSVLKPSVDISILYEKHTIDNIINDCVVLDIPIIAGVIAHKRYSNAGIIGIKGSSNQVKNRYINGGHSSYFDELHLESWINILNSGEVEDIDLRKLGFFHDIYYPIVSSKNTLRGILILLTSILIYLLITIYRN